MPPYGFDALPRRTGPADKELQLENIRSAKNTLVLLVCTYVDRQKALWRKVPWLALQADGRTGYLGHFSVAYSNGLWCLSPSGRALLEFVDCATGKLVDGQLNDLDDERVLALASRLRVLNAETVLAELDKERHKERPSYYTVDQWERAEQWRQRKIKEEYVRTRAPEWDTSID